MSNSARQLAETIHGISRLAQGAALTPQMGHSSVAGGIVITDNDGYPIGAIGGDGKGGVGAKPYELPPAPMPTTPEVTADAGFIRVRWDGLWADAEDPRLIADPDILSPTGMQVIEVHVSLDPNFAPSRVHSFAGSFDANADGGSLVVGPLIEAGEYWVALRVRMVDGHTGELSGKASIGMSGVQLDSKLFELALADDEIRRTADGKNGVYYGDEEPERHPVLDSEGNPIYDQDGNQLFHEFSDGDLWFGPDNVPHIFDEDTGEWENAGDARVAAIEQAQEDLRGDLEAVITDGTGMKSFYSPTEPAKADSSEGDLWFDTSAAGKNAPHIFRDGTWVSVADARVSVIQQAQDELAGEITAVESRAAAEAKSLAGEALADANKHTDTKVFGETQIGKDAITSAKIKAGAVGAVAIAAESIEGKHVKANSLSADKLLIGSGGNLIPWSQVLAGETADPHYAWADHTMTLRPADYDRGLGNHLELKSSASAADGVQMAATFLQSEGKNLVVVPGSKMSMTATVMTTYGSFTQASLGIDWLDGAEDGAGYIDSAMSDPVSTGENKPKQLEMEVTVPDDIQYAAVHLFFTGGATVRVIDLSLRPQGGATSIADGAITTDKMAVGAITAESGIIGSINAGTILFGEMDGARIKAKSIRSSQLLIGGTDNLLPGAEGNWPDGNQGWSQFEHDSFNKGLRLKGAKTARNDEEFYLPAGEYLLEMSIYAGEENTACYVQLDGVGYAPDKWVPGLGWTQFSATIPVETARYTRLVVFANHSSGAKHTGFQHFKNISLRSKAGATLIQDGAITTKKIATGAITADSGIIGSLDAGVITTGELRGELIRANSIAGSKLAATAIDGKTITGATVRTASAGARVEMNKYGLWQYNANGQLMTEMSAGNFTAVGNFQTGLVGERRVVMSNRQFTNGVGLRFFPDASGAAAGIQALTQTENGGGFTPGSMTITTATAGGLFQEISMSAPTSADYGRIRIGTRNGATQHGGYLETNENGRVRAYAKLGQDLQLWSTDGGDVSIDSDSEVRSNSTGQFRVDTDSNVTLYPDGNLNLWSDAEIDINPGTDIDLYCRNRLRFNQLNINTTGMPLRMSNGWYVGYEGSSRRYKVAEEPLADSIDNFEDKLLSIEAKTWFDRNSVERVSAYMDAQAEGLTSDDDLEDVDELRRIPGVIAEDLHDAGLSEFVFYNAEGTPESVMYDRIGPALIPIVRSQRDRINDLESRLAALEAA